MKLFNSNKLKENKSKLTVISQNENIATQFESIEKINKISHDPLTNSNSNSTVAIAVNTPTPIISNTVI